MVQRWLDLSLASFQPRVAIEIDVNSASEKLGREMMPVELLKVKDGRAFGKPRPPPRFEGLEALGKDT